MVDKAVDRRKTRMAWQGASLCVRRVAKSMSSVDTECQLAAVIRLLVVSRSTRYCSGRTLSLSLREANGKKDSAVCLVCTVEDLS